jgi:hypothetical protein
MKVSRHRPGGLPPREIWDRVEAEPYHQLWERSSKRIARLYEIQTDPDRSLQIVAVVRKDHWGSRPE